MAKASIGGAAAAGAVATAVAATAEVNKTYVVHGAQACCSCGSRASHLVVPLSHGTFIHGSPQLNIADSVPTTNVQVFGLCTNPNNPAVKAEAQKIVDNIKNRKKGFMDKVMDFFSKPPKLEVNEDLIKKCAAMCTPVISMKWVGGKEDVIVEDEKALLSSCNICCLYGGQISIVDDGQPK